MGDMTSMLDPVNLTGKGSGGSQGNMGIGGIGNVGREFTGKPSPESQEQALKASTQAQQWLTDMSKGYYEDTAGMRGNLIGNLTNFLNGNYDPASSPMYAPIKMNAERQYDVARNQTLSDMPEGGALYASLQDLGAKKAGTLTDEIGKLVADQYAKAYAMGQGSQQVAASGVTNAGNLANQTVSGLAQQQGAGAQGVGNAVGLISALAKVLATALA